MKALQVIGLLVCAGILVSCETYEAGGQGNQEQKRLAAVQEQRTQPQMDQSEQNLQNAQADLLNRGTNPSISY